MANPFLIEQERQKQASSAATAELQKTYDALQGALQSGAASRGGVYESLSPSLSQMQANQTSYNTNLQGSLGAAGAGYQTNLDLQSKALEYATQAQKAKDAAELTALKAEGAGRLRGSGGGGSSGGTKPSPYNSLTMNQQQKVLDDAWNTYLSQSFGDSQYTGLPRQPMGVRTSPKGPGAQVLRSRAAVLQGIANRFDTLVPGTSDYVRQQAGLFIHDNPSPSRAGSTKAPVSRGGAGYRAGAAIDRRIDALSRGKHRPYDASDPTTHGTPGKTPHPLRALSRLAARGQKQNREKTARYQYINGRWQYR